MAAAIGARLPITEPVGNMVVDIGGGTTEIAVISLGGVVTWRSLRIAGDEMNKNIVNYARENFNLILGERVAENIKICIGTAMEQEEPLVMEMRGRDMITGLPKEILVNDKQIRQALARSVRTIVENIKLALEMTPPELVADIYERGIVLTGGGALLKGLDKVISDAAEIPVRITDDPLTCVVRGAGFLLDNLDLLQTVALPSSQEQQKEIAGIFG
jgi:rod shape-determining protein MreB